MLSAATAVSSAEVDTPDPVIEHANGLLLFDTGQDHMGGLRSWAAPTCWSPRPSGRRCRGRRLSPAASCATTSSSPD